MVSRLALGASMASTSVQLLFVWGVELVLVLILWRNHAAPASNFMMFAFLVFLWTAVSVIMSLRLYKKTGELKSKAYVEKS